MVACEHASGASYAGLYLISHEEYIVLLTEVVALFQIAVVRHVYACLALDRLGQEGRYPVAFFLQHLA